MKLTKIYNDEDLYTIVLLFEDGTKIYSEHENDCCECHYLDFTHTDASDFDGLEFDLEGDKFFERVKDYGIRLLPTNGHPIAIPGYGSNNGYYSHELKLIVLKGETVREYDISECQDIKWD